MSEKNERIKSLAPSAEKLDNYIRVGSTGGLLVIAGLAIIAVAVIIWGFTGSIPVTMTQPGVVIEQENGSHTCLCFIDINENTGVLPAGGAVMVRMADGNSFSGKVAGMSNLPLSIEEIHEQYSGAGNEGFSDWVFENLLRDSRYCYTLQVTTDEDISAYWHQIADVTIVLREVRPISYLFK